MENDNILWVDYNICVHMVVLYYYNKLFYHRDDHEVMGFIYPFRPKYSYFFKSLLKNYYCVYTTISPILKYIKYLRSIGVY